MRAASPLNGTFCIYYVSMNKMTLNTSIIYGIQGTFPTTTLCSLLALYTFPVRNYWRLHGSSPSIAHICVNMITHASYLQKKHIWVYTDTCTLCIRKPWYTATHTINTLTVYKETRASRWLDSSVISAFPFA